MTFIHVKCTEKYNPQNNKHSHAKLDLACFEKSQKAS